MSCYSLILCYLLSLFGNEPVQFVQFNNSNVVIIEENNYVAITLSFEVLEGYHIQSNSENLNGLISTDITFNESDDYKIESHNFSSRQDEVFFTNGERHKVISNQFDVTVTLKLNTNVSNVALEGELYYQACTDRQCLFPRALNFQISI